MEVVATFAAPQRHVTFFIIVIFFSLFSPLHLLSRAALYVPSRAIEFFYQLKVYIAVTKPIMQFLLALYIALISATVAFASPENEKPQGLNATRWKYWPSSLRSLLQVDIRPNEEYHESQQSSFRSRISRRRHSRRYHP